MTARKEILTDVKQWVKEVGNLQVDKLGTAVEVNTKSTGIDLVTEVDELSEDRLIAKITEKYPQHSIISEEFGELDNQSAYTWIIDPLDGTTNYAQGFAIFSVSVAVQYKEETIIGVVYIPRLDDLYWTAKGEGAYLNEHQLQVSTTDNLAEAVLASGFPYDRATDKRNNIDNFSKLVPQVRGVRRTGSAAFDLCNVASGVFDGYWELKLNPWDIAAGALLIEEAGGVVSKFSREKGITIIAGNSKLQTKLLDQLETT